MLLLDGHALLLLGCALWHKTCTGERFLGLAVQPPAGLLPLCRWSRLALRQKCVYNASPCKRTWMDEAGMIAASIITPAEMAAYRATARRRQEREQQELVRRQARAWELARCAAARLKAQFGVERVMV